MTPLDDRFVKLLAGIVKQAIADYTAPLHKRKVSQKHRRSAEAFFRRLGFIRPDGSLGRPLKD